MRVGVNALHLGPAIGGLRQYLECLLPALLQARPDWRVSVFHSSANAADVAAAAPGSPRLALRRVGQARDVRRLAESLDLYFCPFGILDPRPLPLPSVVTLVDVQERHLPGLFSPAALWNRALHFEGSTRQADAVVTLSEFSRASIARHHGIPRERIHVAPLSPDPRLLQAPEPPAAFTRALPGTFFLYPANHWRHKNHALLLRALRRLLDAGGAEVHLVLTGFEQPDGFALAPAVRELGLEPRVRMLGFVGRSELAQLYRRALALVFPSRFEGFGLPLAEAMALGCPIAAADAAAVPEVVGDAALLFGPEDVAGCAEAMGRLLGDAGLRQGLARRGRERARLYTPERTAAAHVEAFEAARRRFAFPDYLRRRLLGEPWHRLRHHFRHGLRPPVDGPGKGDVS